MKAAELVDLSAEELERRLKELEQEYFNLRFQNTVGQLENPMRIRQVKKDIARIKTVQNRRVSGPGRGE